MTTDPHFLNESVRRARAQADPVTRRKVGGRRAMAGDGTPTGPTCLGATDFVQATMDDDPAGPPITVLVARSRSPLPGESLELAPASDRAPMAWTALGRPERGDIALYWIGYDTIPAVWKLYRLLPGAAMYEDLGKPADFADYQMSQAGFLWTIRGAAVVGAGTSGVSAFRLWSPGVGWQITPAPVTPGATSWGLRRNVRLGGDLYTIRGEDDGAGRHIRIWRLAAFPATWELVVSQRCGEIDDLECAWPVEAPAVQPLPPEPPIPASILLSSLWSEAPEGLYSEGKIFWRLRLPIAGVDPVPLVDQHNPAGLMPKSASPYNQSVRRRTQSEYFDLMGGEAPWFLGAEARDFTSTDIYPFYYYPPMASRYDRASDAWIDQAAGWTRIPSDAPPTEYWIDAAFVWSRDASSAVANSVGGSLTDFVDDGENIAFAAGASGWLYATMNGGGVTGQDTTHTLTPNGTLQTAASAAAHYGPPDASAGQRPYSRVLRQRPSVPVEVLASMTIVSAGAYDRTFGFHGVVEAGDGTVLIGVGKGGQFGATGLAEPHPSGPYGYPNGGVYMVHPGGGLIAWPPLQSIFNGSTHGVLRLYSSVDAV